MGIRSATTTRAYAASTTAIIHTETATRAATAKRAVTAKRAAATTRSYTHDPILDSYRHRLPRNHHDPHCHQHSLCR